MDRRGRELAFTSNAGKIHAVAQDLRPLENVQISVFLTNIMHSFVYLRRERGLVRELCQHNIIVFIEGISGGFYLHTMYTHHRQGMWINRGGGHAPATLPGLLTRFPLPGRLVFGLIRSVYTSFEHFRKMGAKEEFLHPKFIDFLIMPAPAPPINARTGTIYRRKS